MSVSLDPNDLSFPPKFRTFRSGQLDIALSCATSDKRFNLISSPTGSGKSVIYLAAAQLADVRTVILTGTKGLQAQLMYDFASMGMVDVRGQANYPCVAVDADGPLSDYGSPGSTCDEGPCHVGVMCNLKEDGGCTYYDAIRAARDARIVVTNYAFWMTAAKYMDPLALGEFGLVVLDEAHSAPDWLADFCSVDLKRETVKGLIDMHLPPIDEGREVWIHWALEALRESRKRWTTAREELVSMTGDHARAVKRMRELTDLGHGLKELSRADDWRRAEPGKPEVAIPGGSTDWIAEKTLTGIRFSPVWAHAYAEDYLFRGIPRVLMVSAVLHRNAARYLGIDDDALSFREFASTFDARQRPLTYVPATRVDHRWTIGQTRIWANKIDSIIAGRRDRKGIIHTVSYERARVLHELSRHRDIMMVHSSRDARETIARFKRSKGPAVLVSPSVTEGYDFPGDECRYQVIAKVPFVDGRSPLIKARNASDKGYVNYLTALSIIQQVGRGVRSEDDWCECFIVDDHWAWFQRQARSMFPHWFRKAWRRSENGSVPPPPPLTRPARVLPMGRTLTT